MCSNKYVVRRSFFMRSNVFFMLISSWNSLETVLGRFVPGSHYVGALSRMANVIGSSLVCHCAVHGLSPPSCSLVRSAFLTELCLW